MRNDLADQFQSEKADLYRELGGMQEKLISIEKLMMGFISKTDRFSESYSESYRELEKAHLGLETRITTTIKLLIWLGPVLGGTISAIVTVLTKTLWLRGV